jgi:thiamine-phosphate pyrophosphorylase
VALVKSIRTDGVHLDLHRRDETGALRLYREARKALGPDAIVGALCAPGRHMAMEVAELDADYVGFAADAVETPELVAWWAEMMNTPCVAFGIAETEQARMLASAGADFIALAPTFWTTPDAAARLAGFQAAIGPG